MSQVGAIAVRIALTYVFLLVILRLSGKRTVKQGTPFDLLVALVLGDFPDDIIWGEVPVARGLTAIGSVMLLHLLVVWAGFRWIRFDRLIGSGATTVAADGRPVPGGLRTEHMNDSDLASALRLQQAEVDEVREARVEPNGRVSVLRRPEARPAERRDLPALRALLARGGR